MTDSTDKDALWQTALDWVMRVHEAPRDSDTHAALTAWLDNNPAHRAAYDEATHIWLLTGLVPSSADDEGTSPSQSLSGG